MTPTSPPPVCGTCGHSHIMRDAFFVTCPTCGHIGFELPTESATTTADQQQNQSGKTEKNQPQEPEPNGESPMSEDGTRETTFLLIAYRSDSADEWDSDQRLEAGLIERQVIDRVAELQELNSRRHGHYDITVVDSCGRVVYSDDGLYWEELEDDEIPSRISVGISMARNAIREAEESKKAEALRLAEVERLRKEAEAVERREKREREEYERLRAKFAGALP